mgnify:CR=1 FL=1
MAQERPVPNSEKKEALRRNASEQRDIAAQISLEEDINDFTARLGSMLQNPDKLIYTAACGAIVETANELNVAKMEIVDLLGVPSLNKLIKPHPDRNISNLKHALIYNTRPLTDDERFHLFKTIYVLNDPLYWDANDSIVDKNGRSVYRHVTLAPIGVSASVRYKVPEAPRLPHVGDPSIKWETF